MLAKYVAGTSSGQLPTALFQIIRPHLPGRILSAEIHRPQAAPVTLSNEMPLTGSGTGPRSQTPARGAGVLCLDTNLIFAAPIVYSKGLHDHDGPSMALFVKYRIPKVHPNFLAPPKDFMGDAFVGQARGAVRLPPGHDGLRTAEALRPGHLRNTWPAWPPGQPRTIHVRKYTGHIVWAAVNRILSEDTTLIRMLVSVGRRTRLSTGAPLPGQLRYL